MRTKVYFEYVVNKHATDNYICFDKEQIELYDYDNNTYKKYNYSEIDRINISICSRAFSNTIRNNEIERVEFFSTGLVTRFFIDIDIKINNSLYQYESMSLENMKEISNILSLKENVDDKLNLLSLFQKETSIEEINKQLLANIKKWEKELTFVLQIFILVVFYGVKSYIRIYRKKRTIKMSNPNNVNNEDEIFDPQEMFVTLDLDDGSQLECQILTIFDVDNQNYIALVPVDNDDEVIFYRYFEDEEGNPSLENIDHDDEFDAVSDRFDELLDEEEFDQM